jgi:hypothetical protein
MLTKKSIGVALACALAVGAFSGSAFASTMNVGGVVYDPASPLDLSIQSLNFRESAVKNPGDVLMGYGEVGAINGQSDADMFCPSCDLTFTFQYTVKDVDQTGPTPRITFDNGSVNFYTGAKGSFNVLDPTTAGQGDLWLSTVGHTAPDSRYNAVGQLYATLNGTPGHPTNGSAGFGYLDVVGGPEAQYADSNTIDDGNGGLADFRLNSSFQEQDVDICANGTCYPIVGQGGEIGMTSSPTPVPEPAELGLFGLGLGALGVFFLRRRKEADNAA